MKRLKMIAVSFLLASILLCACTAPNNNEKGDGNMNTDKNIANTPAETPADKQETKYKKYFTLSYDDGITQDLKLMQIMRKYKVNCCTFNINTGLFGANWEWVATATGTPGLSHKRLMEGDIRNGLYSGFDIQVHTATHPSLKVYDNSPEDIIREVQGDADKITELTGVKPVGMAWPGGDTEYTDKTIELVLENTDIRFGRGITPTYSFKLPERFMKWYPTCSFSDSKVFELAEQFIAAEPTEDMLFYVWGHSYEMDIANNNSYEEFERLIKMMSDADDVVLVTNAEFYELYKNTIPS